MNIVDLNEEQVDEEYRRKGIGERLIREMEKRAFEMGVNTIRLDTFDWQGKDFKKIPCTEKVQGIFWLKQFFLFSYTNVFSRTESKDERKDVR